MNARLLRKLAELGMQIRVISPRPRLPGTAHSDFESVSDDPLPARFVPVPYIPKVGSRWNDTLMRRALRTPFREELEDFRPNLVLGAWMYPDGCAVADLAASAGIDCALIAQGTDLHGYLGDSVRRRKILRAVDRAGITITRSRSLQNLLLEAGARPEKLRTIHNGVDTQLFQPGDRSSARSRLNLPETTPVILFVGNLLPIKDPEFLVRAIASVEKLPLLVLVGEGPLESGVRSLAEKLGLSDRVRLVGRQPPEKVSLYMQAADLLAVSSRNEGLPNVILEAFSSGLPVVATDVGGISELVSHPLLGAVVPTGNVEEFSRAIEQRLNESAGHQEIHEVGRKFSWERTCDQYIEAFKRFETGP